MEIWKEVECYENYEVSNTGKVKTHNWMNRGITKEMSPSSCRGYLQVNLWKDGKQKCIRIHRLVAQAFIPNPYNLREVNHIDGNKLNNSVDNLEWCTREENLEHEHSTKLGDRAKEGLRNCAISKRKAVIAISKDGRRQEFVSVQEAARQLSIEATKISAVARGNRKTTNGYKFEYKEE